MLSSIDPAAIEIFVGIDSPVSQERPVRAHHIQFIEGTVGCNQALPVMVRFGDHFTSR